MTKQDKYIPSIEESVAYDLNEKNSKEEIRIQHAKEVDTKDILKEIKKADIIKVAYEEQFRIRLEHKCKECLIYRIGAMVLGSLGIVCLSILTYVVETQMKKDGIIFGLCCGAVTGIIAYCFGRKDKLKELHK